MTACLVRVLVGALSLYDLPGATRADRLPYDARAHVVAARHLPLGTRVRVCSTGSKARCVYATVGDRGPVGVAGCRHARWRPWRDGPLPAGCRWRSIVDVTPATARALGLRGGETVRVEIVGRDRERRGKR